MDINKHDPETEMEMNMTSMIDVVFLLIIFFMIITDLTQQDLEEMKLPKAMAAVPDNPDPKPSPSHQAEIDEQTERIRREVARLPDPQREVILLRYYSEMSFKEIADLLGCPVNTALTRAHYGLEKLRKVMLCEAGS